jgi:hypothetical protein
VGGMGWNGMEGSERRGKGGIRTCRSFDPRGRPRDRFPVMAVAEDGEAPSARGAEASGALGDGDGDVPAAGEADPEGDALPSEVCLQAASTGRFGPVWTGELDVTGVFFSVFGTMVFMLSGPEETADDAGILSSKSSFDSGRGTV